MLRGCLLSLLLWAGLGAAYYTFFHGQFSPPGDWIGALVGSFVTTLGIGCIRNIFFYWGDRRKILSAAHFMTFPQEAGITAISGRIRPLRDALLSPFTNTPAALFSYEIYDERRVTTGSGSSRHTETRKDIAWSGFQMTASAIRTPIGEVNLLGFPLLDGFPEEVIELETALPRAQEFIAKTQFEDMSGLRVAAAITQVRDLLADDDGIINKNWRVSEGYELEQLNFQEQVVASDAEVCAVGYFTPEKRGLVPSKQSGGEVVRLYSGTPQHVARSLTWKVVRYFLGALFFLGAGNAILWFVLQKNEHTPERERHRAEEFRKDIRENDLAAAAKMLLHKVDVNYADVSQQTPLMDATSSEMVELLLANGADTERQDANGRTALMHAAEDDKADAVAALIKGHASLDLRDNWGETALALAQDRNSSNAAAILRQAGAFDTTVTAETGAPLTEASEPYKTCKKYIAAIHRKDIETMKILLPLAQKDYFETIDFDLWKRTRPEKPVLVEGFGNGLFATLSIADGNEPQLGARLQYHLSFEGGMWVIRKERFIG